MHMDLEIEGNQTLMSVRIKGSLTAANCHILREAILEMTAAGRNRVQLDLADMPFMDTSGIGVLIGLKSHLNSKGGSLRVVNPQAKVFETLHMMRLDAVLGLGKNA